MRLLQLAFRTLHFDGAVMYVDGDALGNRDGFLADSGHKMNARSRKSTSDLQLPHVTKHFSADAGFNGGSPGHYAARGRQDAGAESAEHFRHVFLAKID